MAFKAMRVYQEHFELFALYYIIVAYWSSRIVTRTLLVLQQV